MHPECFSTGKRPSLGPKPASVLQSNFPPQLLTADDLYADPVLKRVIRRALATEAAKERAARGSDEDDDGDDQRDQSLIDGPSQQRRRAGTEGPRVKAERASVRPQAREEEVRDADMDDAELDEEDDKEDSHDDLYD